MVDGNYDCSVHGNEGHVECEECCSNLFQLCIDANVHIIADPRDKMRLVNAWRRRHGYREREVVDLSDLHNCPKCRGKIVHVGLDALGNTYCGYCGEQVDYRPYLNQLAGGV